MLKRLFTWLYPQDNRPVRPWVGPWIGLALGLFFLAMLAMLFGKYVLGT